MAKSASLFQGSELAAQSQVCILTGLFCQLTLFPPFISCHNPPFCLIAKQSTFSGRVQEQLKRSLPRGNVHYTALAPVYQIMAVYTCTTLTRNRTQSERDAQIGTIASVFNITYLLDTIIRCILLYPPRINDFPELSAHKKIRKEKVWFTSVTQNVLAHVRNCVRWTCHGTTR